jgi:hypothetical protein
MLLLWLSLLGPKWGAIVAWEFTGANRQDRFVWFRSGVPGGGIQPWVYLLARFFRARHVLQESLGWIKLPTLGNIASLYDRLNGSLLFRHSVPLSILLFLIPVVLGFAHKPENRSRFIGLALFAFVPTLVAFAASLLLPSAVFGERHLIIVVVPYLLMVTMGIFSVSPHRARKILVVATLGWSVCGGILYLMSPVRRLPWTWVARDVTIQNIPSRVTISLDGQWQAIVDPYETGLNASFYRETELRAGDGRCADQSVSERSRDWNSQRTGCSLRRSGWYKKSFFY